jgi:hypothetical protein
VQCSAVQCSAVQCSAVQCSAVQCSAVQCSAVQCSAVQSSAVQCSVVQCSAVQLCHCAAHRAAVQSPAFLLPARNPEQEAEYGPAGRYKYSALQVQVKYSTGTIDCVSLALSTFALVKYGTFALVF